ncbi:hypothetical protein fugu_004306 [Takifugu bimaculatus]|uniref:Uncharacterized protein n=1 Tax=Takifugu bimaculatus TaxID=433685 RepID=A0A4Z2BD73_9TELE|nr:hypothetical protein fugu_004306 [Takifugu bimaculatus]
MARLQKLMRAYTPRRCSVNTLTSSGSQWNGSLPNGAVAIFNGYTERTDYVCKVNCEAGFYTPSKGNFCRYPYADKEYASSKFEMLVNVDHFEFLMWVEDSYGSVPSYAIKTCANVDIYVGKNKYGLGKVVTRHEAFFLPWEGDEYWYKKYQVLAINRDSYSQHISHVEYAIDQMKLFHHPPEGPETRQSHQPGVQFCGEDCHAGEDQHSGENLGHWQRDAQRLRFHHDSQSAHPRPRDGGLQQGAHGHLLRGDQDGGVT